MAYDFDGTDDSITGTITAADSGDWTIGAWIEADGLGENNFGSILTTKTSGGSLCQQLRYDNNFTSDRRLSCLQNVSSGTTAQIIAANASQTTADGVTWMCVFGTFVASTGATHLYQGSRTVGVAELSYDAAGNTTLSGTRRTGGTTVTIGNFDGTRTFDGRIARVFFDARLWTVAEMEAFRLGTHPAPVSSLRLWTPLMGAAEDISFNQVALTVNNGASLVEDPPVPYGFDVVRLVSYATSSSLHTGAAVTVDTTTGTTATGSAARSGAAVTSLATQVAETGRGARSGPASTSTVTAVIETGADTRRGTAATGAASVSAAAGTSARTGSATAANATSAVTAGTCARAANTSISAAASITVTWTARRRAPAAATVESTVSAAGTPRDQGDALTVTATAVNASGRSSRSSTTTLTTTAVTSAATTANHAGPVEATLTGEVAATGVAVVTGQLLDIHEPTSIGWPTAQQARGVVLAGDGRRDAVVDDPGPTTAPPIP